jgi:hypothetical protein
MAHLILQSKMRLLMIAEYRTLTEGSTTIRANIGPLFSL